MQTDTEPAIMLPWKEWVDPRIVQTEIHSIFTDLNEDGKIRLNMNDGDGMMEEFGVMSETALKELSKRIQFPTEFIQKLTPELQPIIINDRIKAARKQKFSFVTDEDNQVIAVSPGWRESTSHREVAQITYDALLNSEEIDSVEIERIERNEGSLNLRFMTPVKTSVTPAKGDILQLGLNVEHRFGTQLSVSLFTKRLVCLNGMTNTAQDYAWTNDVAKTKGRQIEWLKEAINEAVQQYDLVIARASQMAGTVIQGDANSALYQRSKALGIPQRLIPQVLEAFNREPGNTEWHLVNAITRFATHNANRQMGDKIQNEAGRMVEGFKMATARLPLFMAQQSGFQVLSTEDDFQLA